MAITIDDFSKIWASTSPLTPYAFSENNYKEGWNFIGGTPPSRQMWDFLQKQNDEKLKYLLDNFNDYLPLSGGTMTGDIILADGGNPLSTSGGTMTGAIKGNPVTLTAEDENNTSSLVLGADGSLALDGKSLSNVPDLSVFADISDFDSVSAFSARATNIVGGYKRVGNIVYVRVAFTPTTVINSVGNWGVLQGFPPSALVTPITFYASLDDTNTPKFTSAGLTTGGNAYMGVTSAVSSAVSGSIIMQGYYYSAQ